MSYQDDLKECRPLSINQLEKHLERLKQGDPDSKEILITSMLRMAYKIAKSFKCLDLEEAIQEANYIMVAKIDNVDPDRGYKAFVSYMKLVIINHLIRKNNEGRLIIRMPQRKVDCERPMVGTIGDLHLVAKEANYYEDLFKAIECLDEPLRNLIEWKYFYGYQFKDMWFLLGFTQKDPVVRKHKKALNELKHLLEK